MRMVTQWIVLSALALSCVYASTTSCVKDGEQCGGQLNGKSWSGSTKCCSTQSTCVVRNQWYSKCMPAAAPDPTTCIKDGLQCGGKSYTGTKACCSSSSVCTYRNEYYSKCMAPVSPTPKPSTSKPTTSTCANKLDSQCGGVNYKGNKCCPSGLTCTYRNEWFSKCMAPVSPTPKPSTSKPTTSTCGNKLDSQCGGVNYKGNTCCPSGLTCTYRNEWFSKCMAGSPSPTPKPSTTKPSTAKPTSCTQDNYCSWPDKWKCDGGKACPDTRVCTLKDGHNVCLCPKGYIGEKCDTKCDHPCGSTHYMNDYYGYSIEPSFCCDQGYSTVCNLDGGSGNEYYYCTDSRLSTCNPNPCHNGAICIDPERGTAARCDCAPGWTGTLCDEVAHAPTSVCKEGSCNYGTCKESATAGGPITCTCPYPYTGVTCADIVGRFDCTDDQTPCGYAKFDSNASPLASNAYWSKTDTYSQGYTKCCEKWMCREQYTFTKYAQPDFDTAIVMTINYTSDCEDSNYIYNPPDATLVDPVTKCREGICFAGTCTENTTPGKPVTCTCKPPYTGTFCEKIEGADMCTTLYDSPCGHTAVESTGAFVSSRDILTGYNTCCHADSDKPNCFGSNYQTISETGDTVTKVKITYTCQ